ncbi:serine hydrolase domain-containing protein [Paenibacillus sp. OAS669]|uniref:serine hydrolase domain-containing protein n=1 Tax=Paenibacillus sp. OAS669 TaxID=2663821 RepID=UPI00178A020A|nr:serine hydrolase [Paenibacillus sp. OAS669]MBE1443076.1 hypothetical protein [Paenibacillus sp. OAS669]
MSYDKLSPKSVLRFLTDLERSRLWVNSFILFQDGNIEAQFWRKPYKKGTQQLLFSLSKSFTSIAVGIAWDEGYLDLKDRVISYFPDKLPDKPSANLMKMTIHHLLCMSAGHHDNIYRRVAREQDWIKAFLAQEVQHEPGTHYRYSTHSTYMLAAIVERATGQSLVDFLMPRLFEPLGIPQPVWEACPAGVTAGGMGLSIGTEGIASFGQMLLDKGMYGGRRIVSEAYMELATREQSDNRQDTAHADSSQGYGYQFFLCREGCYRGGGAFGQLCFVAPKRRIVIAATSSLTGSAELQSLLDLVYDHLIPSADDGSDSCFDGKKQLQQKLAAMSETMHTHPITGLRVQAIGHRSYRTTPNPQRIRLVHLHMEGSGFELQIDYEDNQNKRLQLDFDRPVRFEERFVKDLSLHLQEVIGFAGLDEEGIVLTLYYIETPYVVTYRIRLSGSQLELAYTMNVSLNNEAFEVVGELLH